MRMKSLLPVLALAGVLGFGGAVSAQQSGTAADARALLTKAVAAVKADKAGALTKFDDPNGGFKDRDLYVFCFDRKSGTNLSGPLKGKDMPALKDATGKAFGQEMFDKVKEGEVITIDYMFPRPSTTTPVAKESFVQGIGDIACGVGYYK
jgi:signal transduction histidine kinase